MFITPTDLATVRSLYFFYEINVQDFMNFLSTTIYHPWFLNTIIVTICIVPVKNVDVDV